MCDSNPPTSEKLIFVSNVMGLMSALRSGGPPCGIVDCLLLQKKNLFIIFNKILNFQYLYIILKGRMNIIHASISLLANIIKQNLY